MPDQLKELKLNFFWIWKLLTFSLNLNIFRERLLKLFLFFVIKNVTKKVTNGTIIKNRYLTVSLCTL